MSAYKLTPKANADLLAILSYVARDNLEAADRVETAIYNACAFLAKYPLTGHARKDLTDLPVRFWTVLRYSNYVVVYDPEAQPLKILRILHRAMNISRHLERATQSS
jgi:plasmid stabilization system protein ParE